MCLIKVEAWRDESQMKRDYFYLFIVLKVA